MYVWLEWIIYIVVILAAFIIPFLLFIMSFDKIKINNWVLDLIVHLFFFAVLCGWYYGFVYYLTHFSFF